MYVRKTTESYSNMCCGYCCLQKREKKPVGNSESEGILSDDCLSVWATVWWWRWEIRDSGWWRGEPEKLGGGTAQAAEALHLPFPLPERGVREGARVCEKG